MIRIVVEVRNGNAHSDTVVLAESIRRAVSIARARNPGADVRVRFPIDPERFTVAGVRS